MKKAVFILLGLLVFTIIWSCLFLYSGDTPRKSLFAFLLASFSLPIVYSLLYQKKYPIQTVLVFGIVEIILYKLTVSTTKALQLQLFFFYLNLLFGSFIVLLGGFVDKAAVKFLSSMQGHFRSKRLSLSIPVLAGIICFIVGYFLISTGLYKFAILS